MPDTNNRLLRVAAARADFLTSGSRGSAGVNDVVAASWERSHAAGVSAAGAHAPFTDNIDTGSLLIRCATPVLERLANDTADIPLVIALTDNKARVVQRIDISSAVGRVLDHVEFAPGFTYTEATMGTNGVGTVFEAGRPVSVVGPEHFTEQLQPFACTGAPVIDPVTGRVEGVLDVSTVTHNWSPIMHALVKSAANDISRNLLLDRSQAQQAIFSTYLRTSARWPNHAVLAYGNSISMVNDAAEQLFTVDETRLVREHAEFLMTRRNEVTDTLMLPDQRLVHIRGIRIVNGSQIAGMVVTAEIVTVRQSSRPEDFHDHQLPHVGVATAATSTLASDLAKPHTSLTPGSSPAWVRARNELRTALKQGQPTIVLGESGTGKFTLVVELFHAIHPNARTIGIDAAELTGDQPGGDFDALLREQSSPTLYVIRNIDQCGTQSAERLDKYFSALHDVSGQVCFVATLSDSSLDSDLPFRQLLMHFDSSITIPPLRCRSDDLATITSTILHMIAPQRRVRISPDAGRRIAHYSWPRNMTQLREALEHALRRRPVGEIQVSDLPAYCQSSGRRTLTPIEAAERDIIVQTLRETDSNRVAAATKLGMSRSSLYRKLKSYGITV